MGAYLEIGEERYDAREMRALYDSDNSPLPRTPPVAAALLPRRDAKYRAAPVWCQPLF